MPKVSVNMNQNGGHSRSVHPNNVNNRKGQSPRISGRKFYSPSAYIPNAPAVSPIFTGGVINGRAPLNHDEIESPRVTESRFTIPDIPSNAEYYAQRAQWQAQAYSDVVREFHSVSKQHLFFEDTDHEIEVVDI